MKSFSIYMVLIFLLFYSCSELKEKDGVPAEVLDLSFSGDIYIPLDSETSAIGTGYYELLEDDSLTHLVYFNPINFSLYTYDLSKKKQLRRVVLDKEGPNGLGNFVSSFKTLEDSTILFHSYYRSELIHVNKGGEVISRHKLQSEKVDVRPITSLKTPSVVIGNDVYMYSGVTSSNDNLEQSPIVMKYNLIDSSYSDIGIRLPSIYETPKNRHFPRDLSQASMTGNDLTNSLVISFPLDDSIRVLKAEGELISKYLGVATHRLGNSLKNQYDAADPMDQIKNVMRFSRYGSLKYDRHRDLYLRTYYEPTPESSLEENKLIVKMRTIVADGKFNVLGVFDSFGVEQVFPSKNSLLELVFTSAQEDSLWIRTHDYGF